MRDPEIHPGRSARGSLPDLLLLGALLLLVVAVGSGAVLRSNDLILAATGGLVFAALVGVLLWRSSRRSGPPEHHP